MILNELVGVPNLANEELKDARDTAITLELTNRFATVGGMFLASWLLCEVLTLIVDRPSCRREDPLGPSQTWSTGNSSRAARPGLVGVLDAPRYRTR